MTYSRFIMPRRVSDYTWSDNPHIINLSLLSGICFVILPCIRISLERCVHIHMYVECFYTIYAITHKNDIL